MKKILLSLCIFVLVFSALFYLAKSNALAEEPINETCGDTHTQAEAVIENITEATCTQPAGYDSVVYCSVCGAEISREHITTSDSLGHTSSESVIENETEATCTQPAGYDSVVYCSVCGDEISRERINTTAALGHDLIHHEGKPATVDEDGYEAYDTCSRCNYSTLKTIPKMSGTCGTNLAWIFDSASNTLTISGTGKMNNYSSSTPWNYYSQLIYSVIINDGVTSVGNNAFKGCEEITEVSLADSVTSLGNGAFNGCISLLEIIIPEGVTTIPGAQKLSIFLFTADDGIFAGCTSLQKIYFPRNVTTVGKAAFYNCTALTDVYYYVEENDTQWSISINTEKASSKVKNGNISLTSAKQHKLVKIEAKETSCIQDGNNEYYIWSETNPVEYAVEYGVEPVFYPAQHTLVIDEAIEGNCINPGLTEGSHCSVCGEVLVPQEISAPHNYVLTDYSFYDTDDGCETYCCTLCNDTFTKGHDWELYDSYAPTCICGGENYYYCPNCNIWKNEATPALGHNIVMITKEPTCINPGSIYYYCTRCGVMIGEETITAPPSGVHAETYSYEDNYTEPTCTENGGYDVINICYLCNEVTNIEHIEIPATGHSYSYNYTGPIDDGEKQVVTFNAICSRCSDEHHMTIKVVKEFNECENYIAMNSLPEETTEEERREFLASLYYQIEGDEEFFGYLQITVSIFLVNENSDDRMYIVRINNGYNSFTIEIPSIPHQIEVVSSEATCTQDGYVLTRCSVCGGSDTRYIPATGHSFGLPEYTWNGFDSCIASRTCTACGETETCTGTVSSEKIKEAELGVDGEILFTASFDAEWAENQETIQVVDSVKISSAEADKNSAVKGEYITWKVITTTDVEYLKLNGKYSVDGTVRSTATICKYNTASVNVNVTDSENIRTWVIRQKASYTGGADSVVQNFSVYYKTSGGAAYIAYNHEPISVTVYATKEVIPDSVEYFSPYSVVSAAGPETITAGQYGTITIVTTDDCDKVRIGYDNGGKMKYTTYQTTSRQNVSYSDADGLRTWVINYKFATSATEYTVQGRGPSWNTENGKTFTVTVV